MDPNEIFEYVTEGMKWLAVGGGSYIGALVGCQIYDGFPFHKKIKSQEELDSVVQEEANKLGLDHSKITALYNGESLGMARKIGDSFELHVDGGWQSTRNTVRHELCHIVNGDFDERNKLLRYLFVNESRATIYGTFGIKL